MGLVDGAEGAHRRCGRSVRVEKARNELESSDATLERIASVCGFGTVDTLVRAFRRRLNATPTEYRSRFRASR